MDLEGQPGQPSPERLEDHRRGADSESPEGDPIVDERQETVREALGEAGLFNREKIGQVDSDEGEVILLTVADLDDDSEEGDSSSLTDDDLDDDSDEYFHDDPPEFTAEVSMEETEEHVAFRKRVDAKKALLIHLSQGKKTRYDELIARLREEIAPLLTGAYASDGQYLKGEEAITDFEVRLHAFLGAARSTNHSQALTRNISSMIRRPSIHDSIKNGTLSVLIKIDEVLNTLNPGPISETDIPPIWASIEEILEQIQEIGQMNKIEDRRLSADEMSEFILDHEIAHGLDKAKLLKKRIKFIQTHPSSEHARNIHRRWFSKRILDDLETETERAQPDKLNDTLITILSFAIYHVANPHFAIFEQKNSKQEMPRLTLDLISIPQALSHLMKLALDLERIRKFLKSILLLIDRVMDQGPIELDSPETLTK